MHVAPAGRRQFRVAVAERTAGLIDVYVDVGTSTTELVPRFEPWVSRDAGACALSALASHVAALPEGSRRTVIAVGGGDSTLADQLARRGFIDEGEAPPTLGDDGAARRMWTLLAGPRPK